MHRAVAVDLGATSGRFALGVLDQGEITFEVVEQIPHHPIHREGRLDWDFETLLGLCKRGLAYAEDHGAETLGIDSWGVDHGFLSDTGELIAPPVCYRDLSHSTSFESLAPYRRQLYELTGIQHQPFNTISQLVARKSEDPTLVDRAARWLILPDLLASQLGAPPAYELTQASTTQLLGVDGKWSAEAFQIAGWPVPTEAPTMPGSLGALIGKGVRLAFVGSHDTASAVAGFGQLEAGQAFLNVGTWTLAGTVIDTPINSVEAEKGLWSNERTVDNRVRILKNIPGFWIINRLHEELGIAETVPAWLASAIPFSETIDLTNPRFFNPSSMVEACLELCSRRPKDSAEWAGFALASLSATITNSMPELEALTGIRITSFRVGGGGSQSEEFCQSLADRSGRIVEAGPAEVTVLGNLAAQFLAQGAFSGWAEAFETVRRSSKPVSYRPS